MILQLEAENRAEEMGQWVKCFPHKHEDLGLNSGIHEKESRHGSGTCNRGAGELRTGRSLGLPSSSLAQSVSYEVKEPYLKKSKVEQRLGNNTKRADL